MEGGMERKMAVAAQMLWQTRCVELVAREAHHNTLGLINKRPNHLALPAVHHAVAFFKRLVGADVVEHLPKLKTAGQRWWRVAALAQGAAVLRAAGVVGCVVASGHRSQHWAAGASMGMGRCRPERSLRPTKWCVDIARAAAHCVARCHAQVWYYRY